MSYVCQQNSTWHIWKENDIGNGLIIEILPQIFPSSFWVSTMVYGSTFVFLLSVMYCTRYNCVLKIDVSLKLGNKIRLYNEVIQ